MSVFTVNGKSCSTHEEKRLLRFLRDDLKLTSVKNGCSEGACGSCTVLINGIPVKACTLVTDEVDGMNITTVEGLTDREKDIFTWAFGEAGAVQCGFCIPGMVMCAKGLLDRNPNPSEKEIRHAIRNNICRCTGYVKIVRAIELAAQVIRGEREITDNRNWKLGQRVHRVDVRDKVTGTGIYPDDIYIDGMLHAVALRSKHPRAKVLGIDKSQALALPGVVAVYTAEDIPGNKVVGHLKKDWDAMIAVGETTRFVGDVIALAVADTEAHARSAAAAVKVDYTVLKPVKSPSDAMLPGAPLVHESGNLLGHTHAERGNAEEAISNSDYVLSGHFTTPWTEHAFIEPEAAVSVPLEDGSVKIYSTDQGVYDTRRETAPMLGLPEEKVLVQNCYVGGAFGGKEDVSVQHLSALAAVLTGKPVKMVLTRQESLAFHPKRHPMEMDFTLGCDKDGIIKGVKARIIADTGAYASLGVPVLQRACTHASGPYNYQNFEIDGYSYYTNNPPAGAFRGFGVTQSCFGIETMLNRMADMIGISHWEIRYRNAIRPGQVLPNGQITDNATGLVETLEAVKEEFEGAKYAGIACAMKNAGVGVGIPDFGRVRLEVKDKKVVIHCGGSCLGQGLCTVLKQMVINETDLDPDQVVEEKSNTFNAPDSGTSSGSRHTTISGEAARRAAVMLREALDQANGKLEELEGRDFYAEYLGETDPFGSDLPNPKSHVAYGYATQVCILDEKTHKIDRMIAAHDVGVAVNPNNIEGQIHGGVVMGLGYALRENYELKDCIPKTKFGGLELFRADELPEIRAVIVERPGLDVSNGAKGIGEIVCIPTAPAVSDAYAKLDGEERNSLPVSNTPYSRKEGQPVHRKQKVLVADSRVRCIGCYECVHACAKAYNKTEVASKAYLRISTKEGVGNQSGISGTIMRPVVCIQCGKCASVCPNNAISQNRFGVWVVDYKMCSGCGKCREVCPMGVIVENEEGLSSKCIACGLCAKACPMGVLHIEMPQG